MILKGQEGSRTIRLYLWKTTTCSNTLHLCDFRLCLNDGICYVGLPDYGMRNTLSIVCTRQYPVITGVSKIDYKSRVT